mmetsp:Transcript_96709/g.186494  ORF Transcript_96709/g.186494 Transcript_96709/m.186494 type:complete len:212 (-) Transcript_96709:62-697(-)
MASNSCRKLAVDAARAAGMATHQAAGMAVSQSKTAARLIRTAESLVRSAVNVLLALETNPPVLHAGTSSAARQRRPRGKKGKGKAQADGQATKQQANLATENAPDTPVALEGATQTMEVDTGASAAAAAAGSSSVGETRAKHAATPPKDWTQCDRRGQGGTCLTVTAGPLKGRSVKFYGGNEDGSIDVMKGTGRGASTTTVGLKDVKWVKG